MSVPLPDAPGGAGEIAEAVDRDDHCLLERRDVEGRGEMREVMLDLMHLPAKRWPGNSLPRISESPARRPGCNRSAAGPCPVARTSSRACAAIGAAVLVDGDMVHVGEAEARLAQAICDRLRGETRPVLDAAKALLLGGGDELAVAHQSSRRVAVEGVKAEDDHASCGAQISSYMTLAKGGCHERCRSPSAVLRPPAPERRLHDHREVGEPRLEADGAPRRGDVGNEHGRIAVPPRRDHGRDLASGDALDRCDHAAHGSGASTAEIERERALPRLQRPQCCHVGPRKVADVDEIALAGAVRGG